MRFFRRITSIFIEKAGDNEYKIGGNDEFYY